MEVGEAAKGTQRPQQRRPHQGLWHERTHRNNKIQLKPVVYLVKSDSPPILNQGINSEPSGLYAVMILRKSPSCMASWPELSAPSLMWQLLAAVLILAGVYHLPVSTHVCCS